MKRRVKKKGRTPLPELAPVTMTTVSRGSFTTGILGLDPISLFPVRLSRHSTERVAIITQKTHTKDNPKKTFSIRTKCTGYLG